MLREIIYYVILALCCLYAGWRGGRPERIGILIVVLASLATTAAGLTHFSLFHSVEYGIFAVDIITLGALLWLALSSDRFWPLWATGFHAVGVMTHMVMLLRPDAIPYAYAMMQGLWAYPVLTAMALGARENRRPSTEANAKPY